MAGAPCGTLRATRARRNAVMHSKAVAASDRSGLKGSSVRPSRGTGYLPAKSHVNRRAEWYKMCVLEMAMRRRKCAYRPASNKFAFFLAASSSLPCHGSLPFLSHLSHFKATHISQSDSARQRDAPQPSHPSLCRQASSQPGNNSSSLDANGMILRKCEIASAGQECSQALQNNIV